MKKFLLLLVAAVLAGGLVISCTQPSSYDITLKAGSAEGVAPDSIKVEAINGYNLITWKSPSDSKETYTVYRKTIIDGEIDEGTIKVVAGTPLVTPIKAIAYTTDSSIETDIQYVYGVVSRGYKEGGSGSDVLYISDIVWQDEPEGGYVKAKKPAAGTAVDPAPAVTIVGTPVRGNSSTSNTTDFVEVKDSIVITVTGLVPGYSYKFGIAWINRSNPNAASATTPTEAQWGSWEQSIGNAGADYYRGWTQINGGGDVFSIANYLDYGNTIELDETTLEYTSNGSSATDFDDYYSTSASRHNLDSWSGRLYVQYGSNFGTYPVTAPNYASADGTRFSSNEVKLLDIAK